MTTGAKALALSLLAGGIAVSSALGAAHLFRQRALHSSHQQPSPEQWFEPVASARALLVPQGRKIFVARCAHCHGSDARGDEGPDLHDLRVSDRYIARVVLRGIPHEMPSFAQKLKADDVHALIAYVRSLE